jgi:mycothiol synthase
VDHSSRSFQGVEDLEIITNFFTQARARSGNTSGFLHAGEVWWRHGLYDPEHHQTRLWFRNTEVIGIGWVLFGSHLEIHVDLSLTSDEFDLIANEILIWAKSICEGEIQINTTLENTRLLSVLEAHRFTPNDDESLIFAYDLQQPIPEPKPPAGFTVRNVLENELERAVSVHCDAWGISNFTLEQYGRIRSLSGYRQDLDLVTVASDGTFAAFCIVWLANGIGEFEPVGTRPAYRRQGLARIAIHEGLRRLKALGAHTATLPSVSDNLEFYEACGFRVISKWVGFAFKPAAKA